ncbi:uncharacterized protein MONOS_11921 [Monocercomonoides exilis]|uniref:uncharacterized protein n=1 Tax=Monocercomonoides exilis TaxID=2049356 RepID=UPI00355A5C36|nr:hypothetical protein MONOS_11921 [Monocercomonoides exilis]|eukprot:MONOS_11921.1-p1 / transcript=MONOS_11921.1 / gene=MONOS_11921 / organism=Monocercomonoides_exilis_PA203 / gene_product=unspecified product / transcript_product=unspecified product / location=Mono_scaffold00625:28513-28878(+) / protein_length=91 / sequence_SO=supercontig / SO=protein_coding / is_pseudo=false
MERGGDGGGGEMTALQLIRGEVDSAELWLDDTLESEEDGDCCSPSVSIPFDLSLMALELSECDESDFEFVVSSRLTILSDIFPEGSAARE